MANKKDAVSEVKTEEKVVEKTEAAVDAKPAKTPAPVKPAKLTQTIYIGPTIKGYIKRNTIYRNGLPAAEVERIADRVGVNPKYLKALIVPIEELSVAMDKLATQSNLSLFYDEIKKATN